MAGDADERLSWKEPIHSLQVELQQDFGLSLVESKALIRRLEEFIDTYFGVSGGPRTAGQICYTAVAIGERAGKPIRYCLTVPVHLTLLHEADASVLVNDGSPALRSVRLGRLCSEAFEQGAALSHEDLALLLGVEKSTVRRMIKASADGGFRPPTRGLVQDIGPTVSHKVQVLRAVRGSGGHRPDHGSEPEPDRLLPHPPRGARPAGQPLRTRSAPVSLRSAGPGRRG